MQELDQFYGPLQMADHANWHFTIFSVAGGACFTLL
jgi:hypothetical protein